MPTEQPAADPQSKALTIARIYFQAHLSADESRHYMEQRDLSSAACRRFEIGYAPDNWRGLTDHFKSHAIRLAAKDAGLLTSPANSSRLLDFFRDRLIFPIRSREGELVGYGGRLITEKEGSPKYLNTPETDKFQKSQLLYGLHQNLASISERKEAILVEGYMDVVRLSTSDFDYAVAPMGTALTNEQVGLLRDSGVRRLWICLDGDSAGEKAAERSIDLLMDHYHPSLEIMLVRMPDQHDPDSLIRDSGPEAFRRCLDDATALPDFIHQVCTKGFPERPCLEDKALYLQRLSPFIQRAAGFLQDRLIEQAQDFTGLTPDDIYADRQSRKDNAVVSQWHPLVTLAARWMMFDPESKRIAARLEKVGLERHGLQELADLAKAINQQEKPEGLMAQFCHAHGELLHEEILTLRQGWGAWLKDTQLEHNLETLSQLPFDHQAKEAIRSAMRPR